MVDLTKLSTEARNERTWALDSMTSLEIATAMNEEDGRVIEAVRLVLPKIAEAIDWATDALESGARIIYMGAGTSGRLGVLDAVECPPTFGVDPSRVVGLIAGGEGAFVKAVEGAEDSMELGEGDLSALDVSKDDIVIGLAASGRTPYVIGGLRYARSVGCKTVAIACNADSAIGREADLAIEPVPGPEVLTGSTRLKAGTAQKLVLNMISTGSMVRIGKAYQNLMVDVKQSNEKLRSRAMGIIMAATDCCEKRAAEALADAEGNVKIALTSILLNTTTKDAREALATSEGHVRRAMEQGGD